MPVSEIETHALNIIANELLWQKPIKHYRFVLALTQK